MTSIFMIDLCWVHAACVLPGVERDHGKGRACRVVTTAPARNTKGGALRSCISSRHRARLRSGDRAGNGPSDHHVRQVGDVMVMMQVSASVDRD